MKLGVWQKYKYHSKQRLICHWCFLDLTELTVFTNCDFGKNLVGEKQKFTSTCPVMEKKKKCKRKSLVKVSKHFSSEVLFMTK